MRGDLLALEWLEVIQKGARAALGGLMLAGTLLLMISHPVKGAELEASDGAVGDQFGFSVSMSGSTGLVGAIDAKIGSNAYQGSVYVFRSLDTATGTVTQAVKLTASDGAAYDDFGDAVTYRGARGW